MKYYVVLDRSVQWFTFVVAIDESDVVLNSKGLDFGIKGEFMSNIFERDYTVKELNVPYHGKDHWACWSVSKAEYDRLLELIDLYPEYTKYQRMVSL